jgi:hypothetical protein
MTTASSDPDPYLAFLPKAIVDIPCGDETHQLVWSRGVFTTLDHADPAGERTLGALGGSNAACIDVLGAWERRRHDLRLLALASRGPTDRLSFDEPNRPGLQILSAPRSAVMRRLQRAAGRTTHVHSSSRSSSGWVTFGTTTTSHGSVSSTPTDDDDDVVQLLALGGGLPERLIAEVAAHWSGRLAAGDVTDGELPSLTAALYGRLAATLDSWLAPDDSIELTMTDPAESPSFNRHDERLEIRVPFHWISRVWATGTALTTGRLVLDARIEGDDLVLLAFSSDGDSSTITIGRGNH